MLNSPKSLLEFNEKMLGYDFSDPKPPTLLSNSLSEIKKFLKLNEDIVMKPVNLMAGQGIIRIKNTDKNNIEQIRRFLEKYKVAVSQKYLKQIKSGDTRIIIYDGIIEENVLVRYPQKGDFRANIACGGSYKIKPINKKFRPVLNKVASFLKYHDIFFAGVDMIGKYITEINITSPTGVQQIGGGLSKKIANSLVKKFSIIMSIQNKSGIYLGVDYGLKKTGVAIGQRITHVARPLTIILGNPIDEILSLIDEWNVEKVIIGYPEFVKKSEIHKQIENFSSQIRNKIDKSTDIIFINESYSSHEGREKYSELRDIGMKKTNSGNYDDLSACIILQSWINENIID